MRRVGETKADDALGEGERERESAKAALSVAELGGRYSFFMQHNANRG
jgi:hypothetical protein